MDQLTARTKPASALSSEAAHEFVRLYWSTQTDVPKHEKLRRSVLRAIEDGYWSAGTRLPTEQSLVAATPCSLGTVQRAFRALVSDGVILRRQGSGTIVTGLDSQLDEPWHIRVRDTSAEGGGFLPVFTRVIRRRTIGGTGSWTGPLAQRDEPVLRIDRIFSVDHRIEIYAIFFALRDRFPELRELPQSSLGGKDFKRLIAQRYRVPVHRIKQEVELVLPPPHVCRSSDCETGVPCLRLSVTAHSLSQEPIYYQHFYIPRTAAPLDLGSATLT